jgi:hypothetical protein
LAVEQMLRDLVRSDDRWKICLLRYFNPVGAHESGTIGEDPNGLPNNLMPYILKVASGDLPKLRVWGSDYDTKDGTGVRDYIHVMDVAEAHVRAMERLPAMQCEAVNLGTGRGSSVLEVVHAFERVNGVRVPYELMPRRPGDVQSAFADPSRAASVLGWRTSRNLEDMCRDAAGRWSETPTMPRDSMQACASRDCPPAVRCTPSLNGASPRLTADRSRSLASTRGTSRDSSRALIATNPFPGPALSSDSAGISTAHVATPDLRSNSMPSDRSSRGSTTLAPRAIGGAGRSQGTYRGR